MIQSREIYDIDIMMISVKKMMTLMTMMMISVMTIMTMMICSPCRLRIPPSCLLQQSNTCSRAGPPKHKIIPKYTVSKTSKGRFKRRSVCGTWVCKQDNLELFFPNYICQWGIYDFNDLFKDAGRQAVQVHGHTVVVVPDVEVPDVVTFITTPTQ